MRSHACSNPRENPTRPTNAPIAMPIPQSVSSVLSRLRWRFFQTNPVNDSDAGMKSFYSVLVGGWGKCALPAAASVPVQNRGSEMELPICDKFANLQLRLTE